MPMLSGVCTGSGWPRPHANKRNSRVSGLPPAARSLRPARASAAMDSPAIFCDRSSPAAPTSNCVHPSFWGSAIARKSRSCGRFSGICQIDTCSVVPSGSRWWVSSFGAGSGGAPGSGSMKTSSHAVADERPPAPRDNSRWSPAPAWSSGMSRSSVSDPPQTEECRRWPVRWHPATAPVVALTRSASSNPSLQLTEHALIAGAALAARRWNGSRAADAAAPAGSLAPRSRPAEKVRRDDGDDCRGRFQDVQRLDPRRRRPNLDGSAGISARCSPLCFSSRIPTPSSLVQSSQVPTSSSQPLALPALSAL